jgi:uracil-DNA glycosylase
MFVPLPQINLELTKEEVIEMMDTLEDPLKGVGGRVVHPVGSGSSGIFIIGEAPGQKEDELGQPFVGASGNLLNKTLLPSVGLTREDIYLTNIVKRRPPENRDPSDEEKKSWSIVLAAELQLIKPKLIVCLGRHSLSFFIENPKISQIHGKPQQIEVFEGLPKISLLPLYHPAVALYNPNMRQVLQEDFMIIQKFIRNGENFSTDNQSTDIKEVKEVLKIQSKTEKKTDSNEQQDSLF